MATDIETNDCQATPTTREVTPPTTTTRFEIRCSPGNSLWLFYEHGADSWKIHTPGGEIEEFDLDALILSLTEAGARAAATNVTIS